MFLSENLTFLSKKLLQLYDIYDIITDLTKKEISAIILSRKYCKFLYTEDIFVFRLPAAEYELRLAGGKAMRTKMYEIGTKVVHPMHGAATIEEIKELEIIGQKRKYYSLRFAIGNMTTNVPVENADSIGIRRLIDRDTAMKALEHFRAVDVEDGTSWNKRQRDNIDKIKSGDIFKVIEVLKDLLYRDKIKGLSTSERKILTNAKQVVVSELVLSKVAELGDIESIIYDTVAELV